MKKLLLLGLSLALFSPTVSWSQDRSMDVHYGTGKDPSYMMHEIIVSFRPEMVNHEIVNDTTAQFGELQDFVDARVILDLQNNFHPGIATFGVHKIFTRLTTADSVSVARTGETIPIPKFWATFILVLPEEMNEEEAAYQIMDGSALIDYAEPNYVVELHAGANDVIYSQQASLRPTATYSDGHINVDRAWDYATGKPDIKVGVYDTGIDWRHTDFGNGTLAGSVIKGGYDYYYNATLPNFLDVYGHGTQCAGIIGAIRNNNNTIAGIAGGDAAASKSGVQLYSMKIMNNSGMISTFSVTANAIVDGAT